MGGAGLIASFLDAGQIDEFDIHVIPVLAQGGDTLATITCSRRHLHPKALSAIVKRRE